MKRILFLIFAVMITASTTTITATEITTSERPKIRSERIKQVIFFDPILQSEEYCMSLNIYYEARSSNLADQAAVADVVMNRVHDRRYPDTICKVVKQGQQYSSGAMKRNKCQFSWYCDGKNDNPRDIDNWMQAQNLAYNVIYNNKYRGITEGATHYHATYVDPRWAKDLQLVGRIGAHIYYRWE